MDDNKNIPGLFGQKHSSRDYSKAECWGKNQFNSSFPASLVAYMYSKDIKPIYIKTNKDNETVHTLIDSNDLLGIDPLSDNAYYNYEAGFSPYEKFYQGEREKIDLVMMNNKTDALLSGLEVKLTALPDNTTKNLSENEWGTEIVMRPPTICFLACSICANYEKPKDKERLRKMLRNVPQINHWEEINEVLPNYGKILDAVLAISSDMYKNQKPIIIQPIWKTEGKAPELAENCLDVFVWTNFSLVGLILDSLDEEEVNGISRPQRAALRLARFLYEASRGGVVYQKPIYDGMTYDTLNDKEFSVGGRKTNQFMSCSRLTCPVVTTKEIKHIVLGGGQKFLSPERRFDSILFFSKDLFDE